MKILLVGDIHFRSKKLADISSAWAKVLDFATANDVSAILQAGDVFDHPNVHGRSVDMGTIYHEFLAPLAKFGSKKEIIIIPGNHDMGGPKDLDALAPLDGYPWIKIIRRPSVVPVLGGLSVCAIPWVNRSHVVAKLRERNVPPDEVSNKASKAIGMIIPKLAAEVAAAKARGDVVLMIGHVEVTGTQLGSGDTQSGGMFEFSPTQLSSLKADAYGLAHIHMRQPVIGLPRTNDGYLGTICQLSFHEVGNDTGVRLLDIRDGQIVDDRFVNNDSSPRYYKVDSLAGLQYRKGVDYVWLTGEVRPEDLPEGVIFERRPPKTETRGRADSLNADSPMESLLKAWHDLAKCRVDLNELTTMAHRLVGQATMPPESIGSIDKVKKVRLKNITCHQDTTIDFTKVSGLCGLEGANGTGKTTAIEAILVGLYGMSPSRPYLPSLLSHGCQDPSLVEVEFTSAGEDYTVRREFKPGKTFSHKAYLFKHEVGESKAIAGPKVEDVTRACVLLVGDPGLVLAGIFSSQGESGNILELKPASRKELFAKLLATDKFLILAEFAKRQAAGGNAEIEALSAKIERLKLEVVDEPATKVALSDAIKQLTEAKEALKARQDDFEAATQAISQISLAKRAKAEAISKVASLTAKRDSIKKQGQEAKARRDELAAVSTGPVEALLADAKEKKAELDALVAASQAKRAEASSMQSEALGLRSKANSILSDVSTKYAQSTADFSKKEASFRQKRQDDLRVLLDRKAGEMAKLQLANSHVENAERQAAMLGGIPSPSPEKDICRTCPLAKDGIRAKASLDGLKAEAASIAAALASTETSISEHEKETASKIDKAHKSIPSADSFMPQERSQAANLVSQAEALDKKASDTLSGLSGGPQEAELKKVVEMIPSLEAKLASMRNVAIDMAKLEATLTSLKSQYLALDAELKSISIPDVQDDSALIAHHAQLSMEISTATGLVETGNFNRGKLEAKLESYAEKNAEVTKLTARVQDISKETDVLNALATAFGRDGIPQLIVDSTIPRFQDIMADLMAEFDGKWAIQVSSQKETKSGSTQEVIDILVDDGHGPRDISTYSGGERKLLRAIIRVAFSTLQAERSGKGLKILVLDEATDAMDGDNSDNFMRMLGRLSDSFRQVFVVSHNDRILSTLPNCISFSRSVGQTTTITARVA